MHNRHSFFLFRSPRKIHVKSLRTVDLSLPTSRLFSLPSSPFLRCETHNELYEDLLRTKSCNANKLGTRTDFSDRVISSTSRELYQGRDKRLEKGFSFFGVDEVRFEDFSAELFKIRALCTD